MALTRAGANRNLVVGFTAALMALVSIVLAVACANVAAIMLTRATARAREMALRAALGAGRGRLVRQLLTETALLFLLGGVLGIGMGQGLIRLAAQLLPSLPTPIAVPLALDWRVLLFAMALCLGAAVAFGVLPSLRGSRADAQWLKEGVRSTSGRSRLRGAFVAGQVAGSALLVVLAASFVRVLLHAGAAGPGFDSRGVHLATIDLSVTGAPLLAASTTWPTLLDRVRGLPGVEAATLARVPPGGLEGIGLGGVSPAGQDGVEVFSPAWNIVESGYFATLEIPIVAGRDFMRTDTAGAPPVVVISETIARKFWPGQPAIGRTVTLAIFNARDGHVRMPATVIGVAGDIKSSSLVDGLAEPYVYLPLAQSDAVGALDMTTRMTIVLRRRAAVNIAAALGALVHELDPRLVVPRVDSLSDAVDMGLTPQRVFASIGGVMGSVALLLASMGIYGVTAYTVALRRREFAIRLALGARPARVVRMVFRQGAILVAIGLAAGLPPAVGLGHVLSVFFYGLPSFHVPTVIGTVILFAAIAAVASVVPARQAVGDGWRHALQDD
jgi:predicted permease